MDWARILAYIIGTVGHGLLLRNECLAAANRNLKAQINGADTERAALGEMGHRLGRKAWEEVWPTPHGPIRFWDGFGSSWCASSMGRNRGYILADPKSIRQSSNSCPHGPTARDFMVSGNMVRPCCSDFTPTGAPGCP